MWFLQGSVEERIMQMVKKRQAAPAIPNMNPHLNLHGQVRQAVQQPCAACKAICLAASLQALQNR